MSLIFLRRDSSVTTDSYPHSLKDTIPTPANMGKNIFLSPSLFALVQMRSGIIYIILLHGYLIPVLEPSIFKGQ